MTIYEYMPIIQMRVFGIMMDVLQRLWRLGMIGPLTLRSNPDLGAFHGAEAVQMRMTS